GGGADRRREGRPRAGAAGRPVGAGRDRPPRRPAGVGRARCPGDGRARSPLQSATFVSRPMTTQLATPPPAAPALRDRAQRVLAAVAVLPILATVYQTLVLTDVTDDVIRKGIEGDSYQMIWTNACWGVSV